MTKRYRVMDLGLDLGLELGLDLGLDLGLEMGLEMGLELGLDLLLHIVTINNYFYIISLDFLSVFNYIIDCVLRSFVYLQAFGFVPFG